MAKAKNFVDAFTCAKNFRHKVTLRPQKYAKCPSLAPWQKMSPTPLALRKKIAHECYQSRNIEVKILRHFQGRGKKFCRCLCLREKISPSRDFCPEISRIEYFCGTIGAMAKNFADTFASTKNYRQRVASVRKY